MMRHPGLWMLAAMAAAATAPDPDGLVVIDDPPPPPRPEPRHPSAGILVVQGREEWGRQPEPVFTPWGHRPPRPYQSRRQRDAEAIAAAQAKRERKAAKRLREQT